MWKSRAMRDISQLTAAGFTVTNEQGGEVTDVRSFIVPMKGPVDSPYEGYTFPVLFSISEQFPFKSPSVGFRRRIFHPNVDEMSGSICLDSLNKAWSPAFTLLNIIEAQLPYLLQYPNANDPFNRDAAALLSNRPDEYKQYVKTHCKVHS